MSGAARSLPQNFGDPFGATADPAHYVPREATDRALAALEQAVVDREAPALLVGIPGIGKTLLLRLLKRRLEAPLEVIHLPYAALPPAALANWALNEMQVSSSWDPLGALATRARHAYLDSHGGIVLMIDDADQMPEESARAMADMVRDSGGALRFVAAVDEGAADRLAAWVGEVAWVELVKPMTAAETFQYVQTRIQGSDLPPEAIEAFDSDLLSELHERSGGIPGRVGAEASAMLLRILRPVAARGAAPQPPEPRDPDRVPDTLFPDAPERSERGPVWRTSDAQGAPKPPRATPEPPQSTPEPPRATPEPPRSRAEPPRTTPEPPRSRAEPPRTTPEPPRTTPEPPRSRAEPPRTTPEPLAQSVLEDLAEAVPEESYQSTREERAPPEPEERALPASGRPEPGPEAAGKAPEAGEPDGPEAPEAAQGPEAVRLAPTRTGTEPQEVSGAFERASRVLAIAHEADVAASDAARPANGATPDEASPPEPTAGSRNVWRRLARAAGAFLLCFAIGAAVGQWLISDASDPAPLPIEAETPDEADAEMPDGPGMVQVQINATPWARIWVDGEEVGVTPLADVELQTGAHRFEARFPDGAVIERVQTVGPVNRWVVFP